MDSCPEGHLFILCGWGGLCMLQQDPGGAVVRGQVGFCSLVLSLHQGGSQVNSGDQAQLQVPLPV